MKVARRPKLVINVVANQMVAYVPRINQLRLHHLHQKCALIVMQEHMAIIAVRPALVGNMAVKKDKLQKPMHVLTTALLVNMDQNGPRTKMTHVQKRAPQENMGRKILK
jgi:hypothetical protein